MIEMNIKQLNSRAKRLYFTAFGTLILLLSSGCSLIGINNVEEADYTVVIKDDTFELRDY